MVGNGVPVIPPGPLTTTESAINIVDTVLNITIVAGSVFKDVPYIQAFAGVLTQIINIRDEIQTEKDRCKGLIDKILRRSKIILDGLLRVGSSQNRDQLSDLEQNLKDYNDLLGELLAVLKTHASKNRFDRFINRKLRLDNLKKYDRLVNDFDTDFITYLHIRSHLTSMSQQTSLHSHDSDMVYYKPVLPPPIELMIGRDKEKSEILETLLHNTRARIAIMGAGGMGKTTLALSLLHDPAVIKHFPSRYFVSCEAVTSTSSLVGEIADVLRIPRAKRDQHLMDVVLSSFHGNAVLCLDNFDTIWDIEAARSEAEGFLSHLNQLSHLAMIVTMRGTQRPSRVSWSKPWLSPLEKLSDANSRQIFEVICGKVDSFVEKLLKSTDGIPLGITLVSASLQEGNETSESLWARWEKTRTAVVENGNDRLSNLDTSIHLSVYGPRMLADPNTISILAMLSVLPDGFPNSGSGSAIDELQRHLPGDYRLREAILTMRRVSLLQLDVEANRLRMLAPIRDFCERRLQIPEFLRSGLTAFYTEMVNNFTNVADSAGHAMIPAELGNLHGVFVESCKRRMGDHAVVRACIGYTTWSLYVGNYVDELILCLAMEVVAGAPGLLADCHFTLSRVHLRRCKLDEAQTSVERALELHRHAHDIVGEANDLRGLGEVHHQRCKQNEAEAYFERALELHRQLHDITGEANDLHWLGVVHHQRCKLDEAQAYFERAVELHRQAHDVLGEAKGVQFLGVVHLRRYKLDEAQASFERAIELHGQAHALIGQAKDVRLLGEVHLRRDKLDEAQASFERAVQLHKRAHDVHGEANDVQLLGEVHLRRCKLDEAQASFERAIELHRQAHALIGQAKDLYWLGEVHLRRYKLDEAQASFERAVELYRQVHSDLGVANGLYQLGVVHLRRYKLDEAQAFFERAIELHRQTHSILNEAMDVRLLGEVHLRGDKLDEAQASFERAVELYRQAHSDLGVANGLQSLGEVHLRRCKLYEAQVSIQRAVELHKQARSVIGEADDVQLLGKVHLQCYKLDEAEAFFERATELHRQAHDVHGEANDVRNFGEVYFRRDKLDDAQESFERALELDRQVNNISGEANDLHALGKVYLRRNKLDEAETSFDRALELHRQARSVLGEAKDVDLLGVVHLRRSKLVEAQESFECAIRLYRQAHNVPGEAYGVQNLGDVYLQLSKLDDAKESFEKALALFQQAHSAFGEAGGRLSLGRLYLQQDDVQEAELCFNRALLLYQQARAPDSYEAAALQLIQQVSVRKQQLSQPCY